MAADDDAADIAHGVVSAFAPSAHVVSAPLPPTFFCPLHGTSLFAIYHFQFGCGNALCLSVGAPAAVGRIIGSFFVNCRISYLQERFEYERKLSLYMKINILRISVSAVLGLVMGECVSCCYAESEPTVVRQRNGKPTHEEVRCKHIAQAREKLIRCKGRLENMQAEVEVYGLGTGSPRHAVKAEDMPRLRCIISQLQANPDFTPVRVTMRHASRLYFLNLNFGDGVILSLRAELITTPGGTGISHQCCLYSLPNAELHRELIGIIERALPRKK